MDTTTVVVVGILILVLLFFGFTMISADNSPSLGAGSNYGGSPSRQIGGGGCGR